MTFFVVNFKQVQDGEIPNEILESIPSEISILQIDSHDLKKLPALSEKFPELKELKIYGCYNLEDLGSLPNTLEKIDIRGAYLLKSIEIPENVRFINLFNARELENITNSSKSLQEIFLGGCRKLSIDSTIMLLNLEEKNIGNRNFKLHWPESFDNKIIVMKIMKDAYKSNSQTFQLFDRFLSENIEDRGVSEVIQSATSLAIEINKKPKILEIFDLKSEDYLTACINQPVSGFTELASLMEVAKQENIASQIKKTEILILQKLIINSVATLRNSDGSPIGRGVEVELGNAMLREVHKKLFDEKLIEEPWPGIPNKIQYEHVVKSFLTTENIQQIFDLTKEFIAQPQELKTKQASEFLCEIEPDFWAMNILSEEELEKYMKPINQKKAEILETTDPSTLEAKSKELKDLEKNYSKELILILKNKTDELIKPSSNPSLTLASSVSKNDKKNRS